jgi:hypothetical protein
MAQKRNAELVESIWECQWRERIELWRRSGQTQQEYCRAHGISASSLSHWKGKLAQRDRLRAEAAVTGQAAAENRARARSAEGVKWTEVPVPASAAGGVEIGAESSGFAVVLAHGWSVRLGPRFEAESLRRLLAVLKELSC